MFWVVFDLCDRLRRIIERGQGFEHVWGEDSDPVKQIETRLRERRLLRGLDRRPHAIALEAELFGCDRICVQGVRETMQDPAILHLFRSATAPRPSDF
jgi:hypothetical protein